MRLVQRISNIISARLDKLVARFEDPETVLRQAVRDMEVSIAEATARTANILADEKAISRELEYHREEAAKWHQRAIYGVEAGSDDLARKALAHQFEHDSLREPLEDELAATRERSRALQRNLGNMRAKLAEARRSLNTLSAHNRAARSRSGFGAQADGCDIAVEGSAFARFDQLRAKVEHAEAKAEAAAELRTKQLGSPSDDVSEYREDEIDLAAELAELKRNIRRYSMPESPENFGD